MSLMSKTVLIVIRHGNTFNKGDTLLRVGAGTDLALTEEGRLQGQKAGALLAQRGLLPSIIYCAPLLRTKQTAENIIKGAGDAATIGLETRNFLTEMDYGIDDGQPESDVTLRLGIVGSRDAITAQTSLSELRERGKAFLKQWDDNLVLPEAWAHLRARVGQLKRDWADFGAEIAARFQGRVAAAVTSNGVARFSTYLLDEGEPKPESLKLPTGAFAVFEHEGGAWRWTEWNGKPNPRAGEIPKL